MNGISYIKKLNAAQKFTSFEQLLTYVKDLQKEAQNFQKQMNTAILLYLKDTIKSKYGVYQEGWPAGKNPTPLYLTGALRQSVKYRNTVNGGEVYLDSYHEGGLTNEALGLIHEFGTIHIPARPIWQTVRDEEFPRIEQLISQEIGAIF